MNFLKLDVLWKK
jgi:hypothetical protein